MNWQAIQRETQYVCSDQTNTGQCINYSLNVKAYTHFTSPIERYVDVIVHRLVKARMEGKQSPYQKDTVTEICKHCTKIRLMTDEYERETNILQLSLSLKDVPVVMYPLVNVTERQGIHLMFPDNDTVPNSCKYIPFDKMELAEQPGINGQEVNLTFKQRIYNMTFVLESEATRSQTWSLKSRKQLKRHQNRS